MPVIAVSTFLVRKQKKGLMRLTERNTDTEEKKKKTGKRRYEECLQL